ncbi:AHG_G0031110.mRNA.1.CDS.1 [Saccharomyces cerevisiae]|nr:AHG_G0031110.mRNA.1.CDS.1 [Saccharomyces cerevisiae]CAI6752460.1 AHG_G0031110.mRNA.1.CDS.1 [Saccharomyces cerevisiae]
MSWEVEDFRVKKAMEERRKNGEGIRSFVGASEQTDAEIKISEALAKIAEEHGTESVTAIAIAYVRSKAKNFFRRLKEEKLRISKRTLRLSVSI